MDNIFKLIFCFLFVFSAPVSAVSYYATWQEASGACTAAGYDYSIGSGAQSCSSSTGSGTNTAVCSGSGGYTRVGMSGGGGVPFTYPWAACNEGLKACVAPEVRQPSGACGIACLPPETDNGFGQCTVKECTNGQVLNPCTGNCQTPVTCSSTFETYDSCTNSCVLDKLNCPTHSHANSTNDACLPDPPLACPAGQHDDGSYNCVADDATACGTNERKGYINGKPACIPKTNAPKAAGDANDAKKASDDANAAAKAAQDAADAAKAARDADPTNQAKIDAYNAAQAAANAAALAAIEAASKLADANAKNQTAQLTAIQENTEDSAGFLKSIEGFFTDPYTPINEPSQTVPAPVTIITTPVTVGGAGTCPADIAFSTSVGSYTLSMQPLCSLASSIAPLFIAICFLISGFIVFGAVKG